MNTKLLIDVRTKEEFENGHRDGAVNIPIENIMSGDLGIVATLPKDTEIQCYCASGARSGMVKQILNQHGYMNVTNLGGL
jgi:phage shock protein E